MSLLESKKHRRKTLREAPFDPAREATIAKRFPYFEKLSRADQLELMGHVNVFLAEKNFEGCAGLELTDEMRLAIAAQACLLLLHRETDYFPKCDVILVYPHAYRAKSVKRAGHGAVIVADEDKTLLGESHADGVVVLSWDAVRGGATSDNDGHNVVLHEFAHQLDQEDGAADGAPILDARAAYAPWAKILGAEFAELKREVDDGAKSDIDEYGATNPAEFFAVVTETFFEKPERLADNHPELYDQLASFYKQDPLARLGIERKAARPVARVVEEKKARRATTLCDMSKHPRAEQLVRVTGELREAVHRLGFEHAGFVGTVLELGARPWAWVGEVLRGRDETTVCVLFNIGSFGDGIAMWTLLENGTFVTTETTRVRPLLMRLGWLVPMHPRRAHFFTASIAASPSELLSAHEARVRRVAEREKSNPIARDAMMFYLAARLRALDLLEVRMKSLRRVQWAAFAAVGCAVAALMMFAFVARWGGIAVGKELPRFVALALVAGYVAGSGLRLPVARLIRRMATLPPVPPDALFERASHVDAAAADRIAELIEGTTD